MPFKPPIKPIPDPRRTWISSKIRKSWAYLEITTHGTAKQKTSTTRGKHRQRTYSKILHFITCNHELAIDSDRSPNCNHCIYHLLDLRSLLDHTYWHILIREILKDRSRSRFTNSIAVLTLLWPLNSLYTNILYIFRKTTTTTLINRL